MTELSLLTQCMDIDLNRLSSLRLCCPFPMFRAWYPKSRHPNALDVVGVNKFLASYWRLTSVERQAMNLPCGTEGQGLRTRGGLGI